MSQLTTETNVSSNIYAHLNGSTEYPQSTLGALIEKFVAVDGIHSTAIPRLFLIRASRPTQPLHVLHEPAICLVAQGSKQMILARESYVYGPEQCLVVSVGLPVIAQVLEATVDRPYLCLRLDLDPGQLSALMLETGLDASERRQPGPGLSLNPVGPDVLDAAARLVKLLGTPNDIAALAPMIVREILYRMLSGEHSAELRHIALGSKRLESINRAINWLKLNYSEPFRIEKLAREARLSPSALHHNFKTITAMSPLQYQKHLRLHEARRLMLEQSMDASTAGLNVGYESPSQFSREYNRLFGAPPLRDISRLRNASWPATQSDSL